MLVSKFKLKLLTSNSILLIFLSISTCCCNGAQIVGIHLACHITASLVKPPALCILLAKVSMSKLFNVPANVPYPPKRVSYHALLRLAL
ncbi:hypothetical protein XELAEV_18000329mg [Xenopus laevis]|uniref:Secreted protein n=1 Tax=Xenopus laevis TaxID=8355 RepID=A0A974BPZ1_XENLA|nr:hypothetical protein XELAEV_18000329mg [Xenopus laevis]